MSGEGGRREPRACPTCGRAIHEPYEPDITLGPDPADDPVLGSESYPTEEELVRIATWPAGGSITDLFAYIRARWTYGDWGWHESKDEDGRTLLHVSTGGWSGNESLIGALQQNMILYFIARVQERRGGHYIFELPLHECQPVSEA